MKKIALLALAAVVWMSSLAMYDNTRLVVSTTSSNNFYLFIDGFSVGDQYRNGNSFYINDINSANHRIQIYKDNNNIFGGSNRKMIYDNNVFLKSNTETTLSINMFGNVVINEMPLGNGGWNGGNNGGWNGNNNNSNWNNYPNNGSGNGHNCEGKRGNGHRKNKHCGGDKDDWNENNQWNNNNGQWNNNGGGWNNKRTMNDDSFLRLKQSIQQEAFDDTKQNIAAYALQNNYFTTAQVKELVQLFTFEDSKLAIAKKAYNNTMDKQNYFRVGDVFTFSSSKQQLLQYIQSVG